MRIIFIVIVSLVIFILYVRYLEKRSVFFPDKEVDRTPNDYYLQYEDVYMDSDGHRIHGWWIPKENAQKTILYLHGNAGNIANRLEKVSIFHSIDANTFIIDYRGYGFSEGIPSERGIYQDAYVAYRYLTEDKKIAPDDIIVYGASLGGSVAVNLASRVPLGGVILDSTFTSAADMGRILYPFVPSFLINMKLDSTEKIKKVTAPKLFIHSKDDTIVPLDLGQKLFDMAPEPKVFEEMVGDHVNAHFFEYDRYRYVVESFVKGDKE